jgi:ribosome-binding protein aMBF1 (putative translation factor)
MTIAARKIIEYMAKQKINASRLAEKLGVDRSQVTRWISGETTPQEQIREKLNELAGIRDEWYQSE